MNYVSQRACAEAQMNYCLLKSQYVRKTADAAVMDGEEGRESGQEGAAEGPEETEKIKVANVKTKKL